MESSNSESIVQTIQRHVDGLNDAIQKAYEEGFDVKTYLSKGLEDGAGEIIRMPVIYVKVQETLYQNWIESSLPENLQQEQKLKNKPQFKWSEPSR